MEEWQRLLLWVSVASAGVVLFYYVWFKVFGSIVLNAPRRANRATPVPVGRFRSSLGAQVSKEEVERLVYEEYKSEREGGESVAVVKHDGDRMAAVCAFQNELRIEYLVEDFGGCCVERCDNISLRALLATVAHWADKWAGSEVRVGGRCVK